MEITGTIYLVDDDEAVRNSLTRLLVCEGYKVEGFESGQAFLNDMDDSRYGCILLDVSMPGMTGFEVQAKLSDAGYAVPIVFMTGHGDLPSSVRAIKNGAFDFLEKPCPTDILMERVKEALEADEVRHANAKREMQSE